ncbi:hypothetical protein Ahy_B01g052212 [Arachis hypogaea]|uniref:Uncharacterized protein n=1 Tax=Arachis hypogaea TaxID=3818 RepID=A0A445ANT3_ARAHY|nr:hypothetical protein Ahy_B01g052212 [Arachis hypogaea]
MCNPSYISYHSAGPEKKIKRRILQRIAKNWKDIRHNLYHKFYEETRTFERNVKHRPLGIEENYWKCFLEYRQKEETKKNCKQNALNWSKQLYTHNRGSKTLARTKDEVEKVRGRPIGRGELWTITHKKWLEAIANIESQDEFSKHLSQNDSLAQVLGKEHPGRVLVPCPTQVFGNAAVQPSGSGVSTEEYQRTIVELKAEIAEEKAKRQTMEKLLGYLMRQ